MKRFNPVEHKRDVVAFSAEFGYITSNRPINKMHHIAYSAKHGDITTFSSPTYLSRHKCKEYDTEFEQYIQEHTINPITLAAVAQVSYTAVHNAMKGRQITREDGEKIIEATRIVTRGKPFTEVFYITSEETNRV
jgi:hypothetical protein